MTSVSRIVRKSEASLFWYFRALPKAKREAIYTLCAFCFHIEQIVAGNLDDAKKQDLLKAWQIELDNIYDKKVPETSIGRKIYKNCMRFKIKKKDFAAILDAALLDFPTPLQAPSQKVFDAYCNGSSVAPIYIMLLIMGELKEASMRTLSQNLGKAIELTNILRNIKDDALDGHLYIPRELLQEYAINQTDPMSVVTHKNLPPVREKLALEASKCFDKAHKLIFSSDKKSTRILRFIFHIYDRYFEIMQHRGFEIISPKPKIKRLDKIAIAFNSIFDRY
ncbi:MAG: squalene/phytoene synthase family protein [Alphaproteobacteria bacterium]|nr:squalene/phytoene synthase family protein [Alphaproteobacteria bacterium]